MVRVWLGILVTVALAWVATGGSDGRSSGGDWADGESRAVVMAGERDGLHLRAEVVKAQGVLAVETRVENRRSRPAFLVPDQCGRVTEALLVRTKFEPNGRTRRGSLGALKRLVLQGQRWSQEPDRLAPRRPGDASHRVPECKSPERAARLAPGAVARERWQVDPSFMRTLDEVGSEHTTVRVEVVEARDPSELEFLDIAPPSLAGEERAGRSLRLEAPASTVVDHPAEESDDPSPGQLYDRLLEDDRLRSWLAAQPADSWVMGDLLTIEGEVELTAVTSRYERAVKVTADSDGSDLTVRLPGPGDRARRFRSRPATLPAGIPLLDEAGDSRPTRDVIPGRLNLPSGLVVADGFPSGQSRPLEHRVEPGAHPVYVTLARRTGEDNQGVALATLVVSGRRPVRWKRIGGIGVDGGTASFTSLEGARALDGKMPNFDSLTAHHNHVTELPIEGDLNQVMFSTGAGDGGYPLLVGLDSEGRPARFVLDFFLIHLDWPGRPQP